MDERTRLQSIQKTLIGCVKTRDSDVGTRKPFSLDIKAYWAIIALLYVYSDMYRVIIIIS